MVDPRVFRFEFGCPRCAARLRLQDRSLIGTLWNCPECHTPLQIVDGGIGRIEAVDRTPNAITPLARWTFSPRTAARLVTGVLVAAGVMFIFWSPQKPLSVVIESQPTPIPPMVPAPPGPEGPEVPLATQRETAPLQAVSRWLTVYRERTGAFPAGTMGTGSVEDRLGWQALFREETEGVPIPDRSQSWRAAVNDSFVRRRATELQWPDLPRNVSESGYPATHLAGMSGVGADAARLPKSDPRAGIFGEDRRTTIDDIRDGLSSTIMVVGVEHRPAAWASGYEGLRSLTAEPYLAGPDGLGTGQLDGMFVLLADGSVRFVPKETDPRILRRMAAMADGLPLDTATPGEPGSPAEVARLPKPVLPPGAAPKDPPITVELAPDGPAVDVVRQLAVPLMRFRLSQPTPLRTVLQQLAEMSAVPIDPTGLGAVEKLDHLVTVDQSDTTLGAVLAAVLSQAGLTYEIDAEQIHLSEALPPPPPEKSPPSSP